MKRRLILTWLITLLTIACATTGVVFAESAEDGYKEVSNIFEISTDFSPGTNVNDWNDCIYPVNPSCEQWKSFNAHSEMVEVLTLPEEVISSSSNEELLQYIMQYPLISDMYCYNTMDEGIVYLVVENNALQALLSREDGLESIICFYEMLDIPAKIETDLSILEKINSTPDEDLDAVYRQILDDADTRNQLEEDFYSIADVELLEGILLREECLNAMTEEQRARVVEAVEEKAILKSESPLFEGRSGYAYEIAEEYGTIDLLGASTLSVSYGTVYTPRGTAVSVTIYSDNTAPLGLAASMLANYPNATLKASADSRYNCHSYAWYQANPSNRKWMNNPGAYISDGSYSNIGLHPTANSQRIMWYDGNVSAPSCYVHSGVVVDYANYKIYSKWGQGPVMEHVAWYSPYTYKSDGSANSRYYYKQN